MSFARSLLLLPLLVAGCGLMDQGVTDTHGDAGGDSIDTVAPGIGDIDREAIIYGGDAPDAAHHDAVVALHWRSGSTVYASPFCSGTLISDDVVLTAAHCLDDARGGRVFEEMSTSNLAIYVGDDPSSDLLSHVYSVDDLEIYSAYDRRRLRNDLALVKLSSPISEAVDPVAILPASEGFDSGDIGETLNFAGFGYDEFGGYGEKLQVDLELAGTGCVLPACSGSADADTQISYAQDGGGGPCSGDSGGPAFVFRGGTTYVAGITSYGDAYCIAYGVSTRVDAFEDWIVEWAGLDTGGGDGGSTDGGTTDGGTTDGGTTDGGTTDGGTTDGGTTEPYCGDGECGTGESCDGFAAGTEACNDDCAGDMTGPRRTRYCYVEGDCFGPACP